jgi:SOS-response transcriptional repressor LexA
VRRLTDKQRDILQYIIEEIADEGRAPSLAEIKREFDIKGDWVIDKILGALESKRYISRERYQHRSITVLRGPGERQNPHLFCST